MEQTTLQKRIEERAEAKLLKDLYDAAQKEREIANMVNVTSPANPKHECAWEARLQVSRYTPSYGSSYIRLENEYSIKIFNLLLPNYITDGTDEILRKIDEIDYLVSEKNTSEDY